MSCTRHVVTVVSTRAHRVQSTHCGLGDTPPPPHVNISITQSHIFMAYMHDFHSQIHESSPDNQLNRLAEHLGNVTLSAPHNYASASLHNPDGSIAPFLVYGVCY